MEILTGITPIREIAPPPGTILYNSRIEDIGVERITTGLIRTFEEGRTGNAVKEGTVVWYGPGHIKAYVIKPNLTAEEINLIGELCGYVENVNSLQNLLPGALSQTDSSLNKLTSIINVKRTGTLAADSLEIFNGNNDKEELSQYMLDWEKIRSREIGELINSTRTMISKLSPIIGEQKKDFKRLAKALYSHGVTLIESETGNTRDGRIPIALIVAKNQKTNELSAPEDSSNF